jgi:fumarate hydratase class II
MSPDTSPDTSPDKGTEFRTEHDSMGEVQVPRDALWRAQTQRAVENFPISGTTLEPRLIHALGLVKGAAARVNGELEIIGAERAAAIQDAAAAVAAGEHDAEFPLDVFQTGSGTSSNMNANEVIASLAGRAGVEVHPNDHVNASQSSNDTFPTAIHVAATLAVVQDLLPALGTLEASLSRKADEFAGLVKSGRTHLMDATPVMLGQEFGGYAATLAYAAERLEAVLPRVRELPLGGTAVGTGINTPAGFAERVIGVLGELSGERFTEARNHFEAQGTRDSLVELSGVLRTIAVGLTKICNDLRWMSSGPTTGLAEIHLPDLQPGSSIMPGKVNPVLPEATLMVCAQVIGNDTAVTVAGASGSFELNVAMPVIARNLLESIRLLSTSTVLLGERCVDGVTADADRMRQYAASSPSVVTPLNKYVGYENAAKIAKQALAEGTTIRETVLALGYVDRGELTEEQLDEALDLAGMTHP